MTVALLARSTCASLAPAIRPHIHFYVDCELSQLDTRPIDSSKARGRDLKRFRRGLARSAGLALVPISRPSRIVRSISARPSSRTSSPSSELSRDRAPVLCL